MLAYTPTGRCAASSRRPSCDDGRWQARAGAVHARRAALHAGPRAARAGDAAPPPGNSARRPRGRRNCLDVAPLIPAPQIRASRLLAEKLKRVLVLPPIVCGLDRLGAAQWRSAFEGGAAAEPSPAATCSHLRAHRAARNVEEFLRELLPAEPCEAACRVALGDRVEAERVASAATRSPTRRCAAARAARHGGARAWKNMKKSTRPLGAADASPPRTSTRRTRRSGGSTARSRRAPRCRGTSGTSYESSTSSPKRETPPGWCGRRSGRRSLGRERAACRNRYHAALSRRTASGAAASSIMITLSYSARNLQPAHRATRRHTVLAASGRAPSGLGRSTPRSTSARRSGWGRLSQTVGSSDVARRTLP